MEVLTIKHVAEEPVNNLSVYPDFLIGRLINEGIGKIESHIDPTDRDHVYWRFTSRRTGEQKTLSSCTIGTYQFRPLLARFGFLLGGSPYAGHAHFGIHYENEDEARPEVFSYYWSNEPETELWLKLYLHHIAGVWPVWGIADAKAVADKAA